VQKEIDTTNKTKELGEQLGPNYFPPMMLMPRVCFMRAIHPAVEWLAVCLPAAVALPLWV